MRYRPTIIQYSLMFIFIISLAFFMLGLAINHQFSDLGKELSSKRASTASDQLTQRLTQLDQLINSAGLQIANWPETHQQLRNAAYYPYWRDSRIKLQPFYLDTIQALELYDPDRRAVYMPVAFGMPNMLERTTGFSVIANGEGHAIFHTTAIRSPERGLMGYVLLRVSLENSLKDLLPIREIKMQSLDFDINAQHLASLAQLVPTAQYSTSENEHTLALHQLVNENLYKTAGLIAVLSILFILFGSLLIVNPVRKLARHISDLKDFHQYPDRVNSCDFTLRELQLVCNAVDEYHMKLSEMNADLDEKNQELWAQAHHDPLTGAYNRRAYELDWQHIETAIQGRRINIAFMLIDCDRFKILNDTYGHNIGDQVLIEITRNIQQCLRSSDKLYRLGGDEFATIFIDASQQEALIVAQRCIEQVEKIDIERLGISEPLQISIGLACTSATNIEKLHELQHQADTAMYHAKRPGKTKIAVYDDSMLNDSLVLLNNRITSAVHNAINQGDSLELFFQAIVDCNDNNAICHEALVRIRDQDQLLLPEKIFPVVHDRRIEVEFDIAVIDRLSSYLAKGSLPNKSGIAINLSGLSILSSQVIQRLKELIGRFSDHGFCLEITETALITRLQQASDNLKSLRESGFKIYLDDFGSGYSSIKYLTNMPIDGIKFDLSLTQSLAYDSKESQIVASLAHMIINAGYQLVAEGIETHELYIRVKELGFTHAQGYFLHTPAAIENLK